MGRLNYIAGQENIDLKEDGAALLARLSDGALRDALSLLDQCAATGGAIDRERRARRAGFGRKRADRTAHVADPDARRAQALELSASS
ncbi:MAG: hypothetical protein ACLRSD_09085 [Oscillibacter sp.]